jgi:molybdate transport system substrate-binding protein
MPSSVQRSQDLKAVVRGIGSMATRHLLAELARECPWPGVTLEWESLGGVQAAQRVAQGEAFDLVVLAADAMSALSAAGHVQVASLCPLVDSPMAIAAPIGRETIDVSSVDALRAALLVAGRIGYSTGPSGAALLALLSRWGMADAIRDRMVQARPGVPVAALLAGGEADLGFQQLSEMQGAEGVVVLGTMPPGADVVTTFVAAVGVHAPQATLAVQALHYLQSAATPERLLRYGLQTPAGSRTAH